MWLRADLARVLLIVGLLLTVVAMGGERMSRVMAESEPVVQGIESPAVAAGNPSPEYSRMTTSGVAGNHA